MNKELNIEEIDTVNGGSSEITKCDNEIEVGAIYRQFDVHDCWTGFIKVVNVTNDFVKFLLGRKEFESNIIRKVDTFTLPKNSIRTVIDFSKKLTGYIWED